MMTVKTMPSGVGMNVIISMNRTEVSHDLCHNIALSCLA